MSKIRFECPSCRKQLNASADKAGKRSKCPKCFAKILIPEARADEDDSYSLLDEIHETASSSLPRGTRSGEESEYDSDLENAPNGSGVLVKALIWCALLGLSAVSLYFLVPKILEPSLPTDPEVAAKLAALSATRVLGPKDVPNVAITQNTKHYYYVLVISRYDNLSDCHIVRVDPYGDKYYKATVLHSALEGGSIGRYWAQYSLQDQ